MPRIAVPRLLSTVIVPGLIAFFSLSACAAAQAPDRRAAVNAPRARTQQSQRPSLVVFITIDQMRADYFDRFAGQLTGGLKRLREGGAFFKNGFHDHAITETAPGHAATMSGRFPVRTGIMMNSQGVNGVPDGQVIGGRASETASPARFRGTVLTDWMRNANPATKWLSVSRKDRGAILPLGKNKGDVYWYSGSGEFTSSSYYMDTLPSWVKAFNAQKIPHSYAGKFWSLLKASSLYAEPDSVGVEALTGGFDVAFPHPFPGEPARAAAILPNYPMMDELTLGFALRGVRELRLGADANRTDMLAVSLSTTDAVGHRFGPDSREIHDQILRLDQYLGLFLDSLNAMRGGGRLLVALTSDHGVAPYPTLKSTLYPNGAAKRVSLDLPWRAFLRRLDDLGIDTTAVDIDDGVVVVTKPGALGSSAATTDALFADLANDLRRVQGVLRVDQMRDLARADTVRDHIARRWLHMFAPTSNVRLIATLTPYSYWLPVTYASHGSPHDTDAQVPVLFWGAGVVPGQHEDNVRVVDMAPTLAAILGVRPTEALDGRVLTKVVR
ncbi:MAG: alkaline phosphatase family protein [Gemmatimonadota bacterium]|nr:alkaline phosphatase family protein [Gemmatimonadota bacterium]